MTHIQSDRFRRYSILFIAMFVPTIGLAQDRPQRASSEQQKPAEQAEAPASPPVSVAESTPTIAGVDAKISEVSAASGLAEPTVASTNELLQQAKISLQAAEKFKTEAAANTVGATSAVDNLSAVKKELDQKLAAPVLPQGSSLAEVKLQFETVEAELKSARGQLVAQSGETSRRQARLLEIPNLLIEAEQNLKKVDAQINQLVTSEDPKLVVDARRMNLLSQRHKLRQEIAAYEAERKFYSATSELLPLQNELLQRHVERLENQASKYKGLVEAKRETEIDKLARVVKEQLANTPAPIEDEAKINVELVGQYVADSKRLAEVGSKTEKTRKALEDIATDYKTSVERVEAVGLNATLGLMFRRSKSTLATNRRNFQPDGSLQNEIQNLQLEMFRLQDLSKQASETKASISLILENNLVEPSQHESLRDEVVRILSQRRNVLSQLTQTKTDLFNRLVALDVDQRKTVKQIDAYTDYINEHVLWIRSAATIGHGDIQSFAKAASWVALPANWLTLGESIIEAMRKRIGLFVSLLSAITLLMLFKRQLRVRTEAAGVTAEVGSCRVFLPTAIALANTLLIAALWPAVLLALGLLIRDINHNAFVQAASRSLIIVSLAMYPIEVLRQMCRNSGLGQSHFGWAEDSRKYIRANMRVFVLTIPLLLFFINLLQYQPIEEFRSSLGRAVMIVLLVVMFAFVFRILHPRSQLYRGIETDDRGDFLYRIRFGTFIVANVLFVGLMLFTLGGYYYTTFQIGSKLLQTAALVIGVTLAYGTTLRWLTVRRRKMKVDLLAARREEVKRKQAADASLGDGAKVTVATELGIDANEVSKQAQELLLVVIGVVALWFSWQIWADVVPAVGILDRIEMWSVTIDGVRTPVTLHNLLNFVFAVTVTVIAVKNLPGILELLLLQRLPMDSGARFAVATILRYILTVVGTIIAFAFLKIQWAQFSWLIAAISLGLGFGLQEIVANFVSGLILLLERPVRIGDVVTIEGTTGIVTKIQMRATTVTNWDQQELVVPNKNLITNSIFNWTLSNVLTRISLEFGVAYGTDPEFVREIILETIKANPEVIGDPAPTVTFQAFGDSSLNFVVRCCISGPDKRLATIHNLQVAINKRLADHHVVIPFPQRVLHSINAEPSRPDAETSNGVAKAS